MATYLEIFALRNDSNLQDKVAVAVVKKAQLLLDAASPTANQVTWSLAAIENPKSKSDGLLNYVLAKNSAATSAQILAVDDATLQTAINAAVDKIIAGQV